MSSGGASAGTGTRMGSSGPDPDAGMRMTSGGGMGAFAEERA